MKALIPHYAHDFYINQYQSYWLSKSGQKLEP